MKEWVCYFLKNKRTNCPFSRIKRITKEQQHRTNSFFFVCGGGGWRDWEVGGRLDERTVLFWICSFFWSNCSFQGLKEWTPFFLKERKNDKWTESIFLKEQRIDKSSDYDTALLTGGIALLRKFVPGNAQWHCSAALLSGTAQWQCSSPMHINL